TAKKAPAGPVNPRAGRSVPKKQPAPADDTAWTPDTWSNTPVAFDCVVHAPAPVTAGTALLAVHAPKKISLACAVTAVAPLDQVALLALESPRLDLSAASTPATSYTAA